MFLLLCILVMWLMIFGVAKSYFATLNTRLASRIIFQFVLVVLVSSFFWLFLAYGVTFKGSLLTPLFAEKLPLDVVLDMLFQLCFCLYAVVMLIGSVIDRFPLRSLLLTVVFWIFLVYCPLAFLIWTPQGALAQLGVRDFSGGMVVHLSAGVSSFILAQQLGKTSFDHSENEQTDWQFLGMVLITLGWFGFNAGPALTLNQVAGLALINTLIAIIAGGLSWTLASYLMTKDLSSSALLNGIVVGLVTSTAGVGYVKPIQMLLICFVGSYLTYLSSVYINHLKAIDDVVDSFAMNGIGGFFGSIGVIACYPKDILPQLLAIFVPLLLSVVMTYLIIRIGTYKSVKS
ncbi:ammonium transporter [Streptococcus iniae]|uniref:Ammonium transporter n=2 Tax=Streptococcus iniae TaxID=1346 RepID=A0A3L8G888_STRIN|nr:ammonium transporter [Streptococcus iniae]RLU53269.1 ammonium transporter [Streptococcus iniae]RLU56407.1 ammonium transporter [Streptococcus iniae]